MTDQPNEAETKACEICGKVPPSHGICESSKCVAIVMLRGQAVRREDEIASLRAKLAEAERSRDEAAKYVGTLLAERDAIAGELAKAWEVLREARESIAAWKPIMPPSLESGEIQEIIDRIDAARAPTEGMK